MSRRTTNDARRRVTIAPAAGAARTVRPQPERESRPPWPRAGDDDPWLVGLGTARPAARLASAIALDRERAQLPDDASPRDRRRIAAIHRRSGVDERAAVIADPREVARFLERAPDAPAPSTAERMRVYERHATDLAAAAARRALADAGTDASAITHLVTVSCTGFAAPGVDLALLRALALDGVRERVHVGFMGCHGAINALRTARHLCRSERHATVLVVCCELCSLHHGPAGDRGRAVANALFADGAAAAVVAGTHAARGGRGPTAAGDPGGGAAAAPDPVDGPGGVPPAFAGGLRLRGGRGDVLPDTAHAMSWRIGDHGFEMHLDAAVPDLVGGALPAWTASLLAPHDLRASDVAAWAIHPGGPRLLDAARAALDLDEAAIAPSRAVLRGCGNMSSPTVLFVLDRLRRERPGGLDGPVAMLAFGPGLAAEGLVLEAVADAGLR